jgi:RNA polymerase sigma-B factor
MSRSTSGVGAHRRLNPAHTDAAVRPDNGAAVSTGNDAAVGADNRADGWPAADTLLAALAALRPTDPERARLRCTIISQCAQAARREATRYRNTGEPMDDLVQVATVGLILAVDRFDPARGIPFKHFALPTITGELKRHFRDKGWGVKVSRRVQELYQEVRRAEPELAQRLGRQPTTPDLAEHLGLSEDDVRAARQGEAVHTTRSLNWPAYGDEDMAELGERIGGLDPAIEAVADRDALHRAWPLLPKRLRNILTLRFVDELSQSQIADKMGVSQMHVSRLITRSLTLLRRYMTAETRLSAA